MITYLNFQDLSINIWEMINALFVTLKKCVPAWQKKYTDSNACKNVNDLADYYGDLENQENKECNQDN
jgi:hypothetical protein